MAGFYPFLRGACQVSLRDGNRFAVIASLLFITAAFLCVVAAIVEVAMSHRPDYALVWAALAIFFEHLVTIR